MALFLVPVLTLACKEKKIVVEEALAFGLDFEDEDLDNPYDTLVYDVVEAPLTEAVDETFIDFIYTFLHRRYFQQQRAAYPVRVVNAEGEVEGMLVSGKAVTEAVQLPEHDYFMILVSPDADPLDYLSDSFQHADLHLFDTGQRTCQTYSFDLLPDGWKLTGICQDAALENASFWDFYHRFASDETFQAEHLAEEIFLSLSSDDEEVELLDGNIDPSQWFVFAPEMPQGQLLWLDLGDSVDEHDGVKLVKCGIATSMVEMLTFGKTDGGWLLTRYEE